MHKISIIIPLNASTNIDKTLYSVLNQNYQNFQILIITDQDVNFMQNNKITTVKVHQKSSIPELLNIGINISETEYVCFLYPDDLLLFDALKTRYQEFQKNSSIVVCYGLGIDADRDYNAIQNYNYDCFANKNISLPQNNINTILFNEMSISLSCLMIKKEVLINFKFNVHLKRTYLLDFFIRLFNNYECKICQIKDPVYISRKDKYNSQLEFINYFKETNNLIEDFFSDIKQLSINKVSCFRSLYYHMFSLLVENYPYNFWLRFYLLASYLNKNKQFEGKLFELWFISLLFNSINVAKNNLLRQKTV